MNGCNPFGEINSTHLKEGMTATATQKDKHRK